VTARRPILLLIALTLGTTLPARSQTSELAQGVAAQVAHDPLLARRHLEAAAKQDTTSYEANWRLALALVDIGKQTPDNQKSPARDSLYASAVTYAHRAVAAKGDGAEGHFVLALSLGRHALTVGAKEKVRLATLIRAEALEAIRLDPNHDGAYHVMGRWNAEIMRLSGIEKFFAKTFLGAGIFNQASWDGAERYMHLAVAHDPRRITHRLDLALVLKDRGRWAAAKAQVDTLLELPPVDVMDPTYKNEARTLLTTLKEKLSR
jgi:regulator of microtubule dynamics protein 3